MTVTSYPRHILGWFWYLHNPVILMVRAAPVICLHTLVMASRPSTQRLHHRNLFASGRRYDLQPVEQGFRMTTTSKVSWHYRRRTRSNAVLDALLYPMSDDITRIQLETHINLLRLLEQAFIPTFMTSIVIFVPWHPALIVFIVFALYLLSWIGYRYNAAFEANEMIFFVQKALEDLEAAEITLLTRDNPEVVRGQREFMNEWEKFYQRHRKDEPNPSNH